ncbi:DNA repair protein rad51d [Coemansia sp. RSA 2706]|nr:DNA repair protein rad51d [Coemansia sp. RSA 2706]
MPPLDATKYIMRLSEAINAHQPQTTASRPLFDECLMALDKVGIRTDYDLLLQSDVLDQTPAKLHRHIRTLRMAVLEHFASPGRTAADLLSATEPLVAIQSGIDPLDALLNGGIVCGQIVELCSKEAAINTQLTIEYATAHLTSSRSSSARVIMLLSGPLVLWQVEQSLSRRLKGHSKPDRLRLFRQAMERLLVVDCRELESLLSFLYQYADTRVVGADDANGQFSDLLVIDSIRPLIIDAMQQPTGGHVAVHAVKTVLHEITSAMRELPVAVLVTNGVSQRSSQLEPDRRPNGHQYLRHSQPSLGPSWGLVSHVHIYIYPELLPVNDDDDTFNADPKASGNFIAVVLKSPYTNAGQTRILRQLHP